MQIVNQLKIKATPVFYANKKAYEQGYPVICNEGGSRSSKSYSIVQLLITIALSKPKTRISLVSHSLPHVKRGIYRDFKSIMEQWSIWDENDFKYTDFIYTFKNGYTLSYLDLKTLTKQKDQQGIFYLLTRLTLSAKRYMTS